MSIITEKKCKCGALFLSLKFENQCDACRITKNVICVYYGMMISFRMAGSEVAAFTKVLRENGAVSIEVLPYDERGWV